VSGSELRLGKPWGPTSLLSITFHEFYKKVKTARTVTTDRITAGDLAPTFSCFFVLECLHTPGAAILSHSLAGQLGRKARVKTYPRQLNPIDSFTSWCLSANIMIPVSLALLSFSFNTHSSEPTVCLPLTNCTATIKKLRGLSPRANYTDRAAAAGRRS